MSRNHQNKTNPSDKNPPIVPHVVNLIDNPNAPELLIDGLVGVQNQNGLWKLAVFSDRVDPNTGQVNRVVIGRICMVSDVINAIAEKLPSMVKSVVDSIPVQETKT